MESRSEGADYRVYYGDPINKNDLVVSIRRRKDDEFFKMGDHLEYNSSKYRIGFFSSYDSEHGIVVFLEPLEEGNAATSCNIENTINSFKKEKNLSDYTIINIDGKEYSLIEKEKVKEMNMEGKNYFLIPNEEN